MRSVGIVAILAGIVVIVLALVGVLGQGGVDRTTMIGAVVLLAAGVLLYKRGGYPSR